jgi:serine/threonine protein kinase
MSFDPPLSPAEVEMAFAGKFTDLRHVFAGGQGAVFKAAVPLGSQSLSEGVALKIYFPEQMAERTDREVGALRRISSPELVRLFDSGKVVLRGIECVYVATEFIQGEALSELVRRSPLSWEHVARVGIDVAAAIHQLWEERIVHRDIKPPNIMLASNGRSVLIDLGVARHLSLKTITLAGTTWGTLGYMAPEHVRAQRQLTCKADIFSLGIVLQECLLGRHPTRGRQDTLRSGGLSFSSLGVLLPEGISIELDRMVHKDAFRRPLPGDLVNTLRSSLG